jgi:predicted DNA-binding protein
MPTVAIRLSENESKALNRVVRLTERTKTYILREALRNYLREYVDYQIALDRLNDTTDEIISTKEMRKLLRV